MKRYSYLHTNFNTFNRGFFDQSLNPRFFHPSCKIAFAGQNSN